LLLLKNIMDIFVRKYWRYQKVIRSHKS
jgi:hypothetical protein